MSPELISKISEAQTLNEIDNIRRRYEHSFRNLEDRFNFHEACINAMRRIVLVQREKNRSFHKLLN